MGDPYWGWLSAGLHLAGGDGSTSFPEVKGNSFTRTGAVAISTAQSRFSSEGSCYFPGGSSDRLVCAEAPAFGMSSGSLSVAFSIRPDVLPSETVRLFMIGNDASPSSLTVEIGTSGSLGLGLPMSGQWIWKNALVAAGVWQDFEISVYGGTGFMFKDGVLAHTQAGMAMPVSGGSKRMLIGSDDAGVNGLSGRFKGYLSEVRFMAGVGRNAADFPAASAPFPEGLELHASKAYAPSPLVVSSPSAWKAVAREPAGLLIDTDNGGRGRVIGTTKNVGTPNYPVARRVRLLRKRDGALAREVWSDAAGNYQFNNLRHDVDYVVMAHDHTGLYNAVVADAVTPELMP